MKRMFILAMVVLGVSFATQSVILAPASAAEKKGDDVFMDEGDGDFDAVPAVQQKAEAPAAAAPAAPAEAPAPPAKKSSKKKKGAAKSEAAAKKKADPAPAADVSAEEHPEVVADVPPEPVVEPVGAPAATAPAAAASEAPTTTEGVADAAPSAPTEVAPTAEPKAKKTAKLATDHKTKKSAKGIYVTTKEACPMTREPASESDKVITVKQAKRIWVEEVDATWVRGFNKAGEPGYINRDCLQ